MDVGEREIEEKPSGTQGAEDGNLGGQELATGTPNAVCLSGSSSLDNGSRVPP